MLIEIFGPGCPKCKTLQANAEKAVKELGIEAKIVKISDVNQMVARGVMSTPALAVDGTVKSTGHLLTPEQIKKILKP